MADPLTRGLDLLERLVVAVEQLAAQRDPKPDKRQRRAQRPRRRPLSRAELAAVEADVEKRSRRHRAS